MNLSEATVQNIILGAIFMFFIAIAWLLAEFKGMKDEMRERFGLNNETLKLTRTLESTAALYVQEP